LLCLQVFDRAFAVSLNLQFRTEYPMARLQHPLVSTIAFEAKPVRLLCLGPCLLANGKVGLFEEAQVLGVRLLQFPHRGYGTMSKHYKCPWLNFQEFARGSEKSAGQSF
jgi:hypothetical protein